MTPFYIISYTLFGLFPPELWHVFGRSGGGQSGTVSEDGVMRKSRVSSSRTTPPQGGSLTTPLPHWRCPPSFSMPWWMPNTTNQSKGTRTPSHPTPLDSYLTTVNIIVYVLYGTHYAPSVFFVIVSLCGPSWSGPGFKYFKIISNTKVVLDLSVPVAIEPIEKAKKAKPHPPGTACRLKQMLKDLEWYLNPGLPGPTCSCH